MRIGIFEDKGYEDLQPLTYLRPTFDLRCGMYLMREKVHKLLTGLAVARKVMDRRKVTLGPAEEKLIRRVFKKTIDNRQ